MGIILSLDVGQTSDSSALAAVDVRRAVEQEDKERAHTVPLCVVRGLERYPLRTAYPAIADDVCLKLADLPEGTPLLLDTTGVGRAVWDIFTERGVYPIGVTITGGNKVSQGPDGFYTVPKKDLATTMAVSMQQGRLQVSKHLKHAATFASEAKDFRLKYSAAGNERFEHRDGAHDDIVLAVALATWWASMMHPPGWAPKPSKNPGKERRRKRVLAELEKPWWRGPRKKWAR